MCKEYTKNKRDELFNKVIASFKLKSTNDNITTFTRADAQSALGAINEMTPDIVHHFPATNTLKCRQGICNAKDTITVLRQLARFYNKRPDRGRENLQGIGEQARGRRWRPTFHGRNASHWRALQDPLLQAPPVEDKKTNMPRN